MEHRAQSMGCEVKDKRQKTKDKRNKIAEINNQQPVTRVTSNK